MTKIITPDSAQLTVPAADPFRYGIRYVNKTGPDGSAILQAVPLSEQDILYPQEGDYVVHSDAHDDDCAYLKSGLKYRFSDNPTVAILSDCRIDFSVPGADGLVPDLAVIFGVRHRHNWATFRVAEDRARIILLMEVTSPSTRFNDLEKKVELYHLARIPWYIIVDANKERELRTLQLIGYRYAEAGYVRFEPNERGWLWLEPVQLWLGVEGSRVAYYDAQGNRIGDYTDVAKARETAETRLTEERSKAETEIKARNAAEAKAFAEAEIRAAAEARAAVETEARLAAEARLKDLEAELQRLRQQANEPSEPGQE